MSSRGAASLIASTSTASFRPSRRYLTTISKHASSSRTTLPSQPDVASCSRSRRPITSTSSSSRPQADPSPLPPGAPVASVSPPASSSCRVFPSRDVNRSPLRPTTPTPQSAQKYLTDLLALPSDRQFSPALSIQILTHKSYTWTNVPHSGPSQGYKHDRSTTSRLLNLSGSPVSQSRTGQELEEAWFAASNSRLQFVGRRAMATYLPLFIHSSLRNGKMRLQDLDFLGEMTLDQRIDEIRDSAALGRTVGNEWQVGDMMRWDVNENAMQSGAVRIKGSVVEAIVGAVFSEFGSPAAQRLFHSRILPSLIQSRGREIRDPYLREKVNEIRDQVKQEFRGGFLLPAEGIAKRIVPELEERVEDVLGSGGKHVPNLEAELGEVLHAQEDPERRFATA